MDKNTIIGLVLIGVLLVGFSILSRPSQEQLEAQQHYYDSIAQVQQREAELKAKQEAALENERIARRDSSALFHQALHGTDQEVTIENNVASLTLHTKGGVLYQSVLKEYKEQDKQTPLTLVRGGDAEMNFLFYNSDEIIETKDYYFTPVQQTDELHRLLLHHASGQLPGGLHHPGRRHGRQVGIDQPPRGHRVERTCPPD